MPKSLICDFRPNPPEFGDTARLESISLNGCCEWATDDILTNISTGGHIRSAQLFRCLHLTHRGIFNLVKKNPVEQLMLAGCTGISDKAMRFIGKYCTNLIELDITRCPFVTDIGINYLVDVCGNTLTSINLYANSHLSTSAYQALCFMTNLKRIDLCGHSNLRSKDLIAILSSCEGLEYLNLSWCVNLDDEFIEYVIRENRLRNVRFLSVFGIRELGQVHELVKYLSENTHITELDIRGIPNVADLADDDCRLLREKIPSLTSWKLHT